METSPSRLGDVHRSSTADFTPFDIPLRFSIRHLIAFVTLFAFSLATGIPGTSLLPDGVWKVTSLYEKENGGMWHGEDPDTGEPWGDIGMDYVITIRDGFRSRTVSLGDTNIVWDHQAPAVGGYVLHQASKTDTHGTLPVTVIEELPRYTIVLRILSSLLASAFLVCFSVIVNRVVVRYKSADKLTR